MRQPHDTNTNLRHISSKLKYKFKCKYSFEYSTSLNNVQN